MTRAVDAGKAGAAVFLAAILQVTIVSSVVVAGGTPDLLLVTVVTIALLRGSIVGAATGFFAGLVVDAATLETLGLSSLLLTLAGYWTGRYGETSGRDRGHAPLVAVLVVTVLFAAAALALHFVLGADVSPRLVLVETLVPAAALNLLLTPPVHALCRRLLRTTYRAEGAVEVRLLG